MPKESHEWEQQLAKDFQEWADAGMWEGDDKYTKNFGIGNVVEWWVSRIAPIRKEAYEEGYCVGLDKGTGQIKKINGILEKGLTL